MAAANQSAALPVLTRVFAQTPRVFSRLADLATAPDETILRPRDVADLLGNSRDTLRRWQRDGRGPPTCRLEGRPRYRLGELRAWLASRPS